MDHHIARPPTPQAMVHRMPDKLDNLSLESSKQPDKFIIIVVASTAVAGKLQLATTVSTALRCPLYQGDSLHESAAKAATLGTDATGGVNEGRYQRMWLSKMTRTGLLFPEQSRAAGAGFSGFGGGTSSTSTSRRGSASSDASNASGSDVASVGSSVIASSAPRYINRPLSAALPQTDAQSKADSALILLTHPKLESWQKTCIRKSVGEYSIGVIFVPLDPEDEEDEDDLPLLRPLDPSTMTSFGSLASFGVQRQPRDWAEEIVVKVNIDATVDDLAEEVVEKVRDVMNE